MKSNLKRLRKLLKDLNKVIVIGLSILLIGILSGCADERDSGILEKRGNVIKIEYDVIFGGTFTDYRDELYFDDGTMLMIQGGDLSTIELNRTGIYRFRKNYFEYDGTDYKFHKFIGVEYLDMI